MSDSSFNYFLLDTFSDELFKGNPTPVCIVDVSMGSSEMAALAKEFLAPVSVFIHLSENENEFRIRYYTITGEIPACGHGTLGAAYVVFEYFSSEEALCFTTIEGTQLKATKEEKLVFIEYPKFEPVAFKLNHSIKNALGIDKSETFFYCQELESLFIEFKEEDTVRKMKPDFDMLLKASNEIKEVVVMSKSEFDNYDFILRSFCPWIGINEDPVTGSIHAVLGHYWKAKLNKDVLKAYQASERGGLLIIKPQQNSVKIGGNSRVLIEGKMKTHN